MHDVVFHLIKSLKLYYSYVCVWQKKKSARERFSPFFSIYFSVVAEVGH